MAAITTAAVGVATEGIQIAGGAKAKRDAKNALANLEVPELTNAFEDLQISTVGSDLMREETQRTSANVVDAVRSGGVRSVMGAVPQIVAQNNRANQEARNYLDNQVQRKSYAMAQDEQRIQGMTETRYLGDVQGYNNAIQEGNQNMWSGMRGVFGALSFLARGIPPDDRPKDLESVQSSGFDTVTNSALSGGASLPTYDLPPIEF